MSLDLKRAVAQPIASVDSLVEVFRSAEKPRSEHRLGLEHEKFVYPKGAAKPAEKPKAPKPPEKTAPQPPR